MKYIIFDLEWNQPSSHEEKDPALPHGEIIQIGYFVVNEALEALGKKEITVKPVCYPNMNQYVSALTGITQRQAERGVPFPDAFREMAGNFDGETVLFTWGDDDMPILRENMAFHSVEAGLPAHYNLQRIFCAQTQTPLRQIGLKTAAELFGINTDVQSHNALNDAYITLLIAGKLNISRGIAEYSIPVKVSAKDVQQPWLNETPVFTGEAEYAGTLDGMASFCRSMCLKCPVCGESMKKEKLCRHGKASFITKAFCENDGCFFARFEKKEPLVTINVYDLSEPLERVYKSRLRRKEKSEQYRRMCHSAGKNGT